jgi:hypothetical protein
LVISKVIALNYILSQIKLEAKGYGIKNSIVNFMNQLSCTLDATRVYQPNEGFIASGVETKLEALVLLHLTN